MSFPLTLDLSATAVTLKPGATASVVVTVRNVSPIVQHYEALVVGLPSDDLWSRDVDTVKLRPGEGGSITVTLALPATTQLLGGSYVLGVLVRSPYQPREVSRAEELTMVVEAVAGVTLSAFPEIVQGKDEGHVSVSVANTGNTPVTLDLVAVDDQGKADFTINPPVMALAAGSTQPAQVTIRSRGPFSGPERRSAVTVRALAGGTPRGEAKVTFVQQPRVAAAVLRGLGVVLAVAVIAASIIVGGVYGKSNQATTAPPTAASAPATQPTSVTTSAAGAKPPAAPKIKLDPAQPVVAEQVTIAAQVTKGVTAFAWTTTKPDGTSGPSSTEAQFTPSLDPAGAWKVKLTITGVDQTSSSSAELAFTVKEKPPNVEVVSQSIEVKSDKLTTTTVSCPEGKFAVGGGAYATQDAAQVLLFEGSMPIEGGKGWSVALLSTGDDLTVTGYATCIADIGLQLVTTPEEEASDTRRPGTATCPSGTVAVGGGGGFAPVDDTGSRAFLDESAPVPDADGTYTSWSVLAESTTPRILQTAVWCAPQPAGYSVQVNPLAAATGTGGVEPTATCATGQALSGGIAFVQGAGAVQVDPTRSIILRSSAPLTAQAGQTGEGWVGSATFTVALDQAIGAYVVCAQLNA